MKKILIISFSNLSRAPRVYRQVKLLKEKYKVSTAGFEKTGIENGTFYRIGTKRNFLLGAVHQFMLIFRMFEKAYWIRYKKNSYEKLLSNKGFDLIIAHDINTLLLALKISNGAKILFDAHEYYPWQFKNVFFRNYNQYNNYFCKTYLKKCDKIITVSDNIANKYYENFGVKSIVIKNAALVTD